MLEASGMNTRNAADPPEGFKTTELGPLPEEWRVVRLGEVATLIRGISWGKREQSTNGVPVIAIPNIHNGRVSFDIRYKVDKKISEAKRLREGDILLVGSSGSLHNVGRTAIVRELPFKQATFASFLIKIVPMGDIDRGYLFHLLSSQVVDFDRCSKRAADGKYNLQVRALKEHLIPLPPLPEQRAIAYVLRTVQRAKEATERVIAALKELKKSLMKHLFTYGPVPLDQADQVPLKETEIGPIPEHWNVVQLGEILKLRKGTIHPDEVPNARYVGLEHLDSGEIWIRRFGKASDTKSAKAVFKTGDILYGKLRPYLDKAALAEWDGVCSTDILVLTPQDDFDAVFTAYLIHSSFVLAHAVATTTGVNHPRTSWRALKQAAIPLPPLEEQHEIARILQTVDRKIEAEEARKEALEALFRTLLHHLMTAKVRLTREFIATFEKELEGTL